jgi:hypothetical protein
MGTTRAPSATYYFTVYGVFLEPWPASSRLSPSGSSVAFVLHDGSTTPCFMRYFAFHLGKVITLPRVL